MRWTLEVVHVPVHDVERAKAFYAEQLGFTVDIDVTADQGRRFVQLTPPGSGCSIQLSAGYIHDVVPGSLRGLVVVVPDVRAAHAQLVDNGVENGGVVVSRDGVTFAPAQEADELDNVGFVRFSDPDGNEWLVQQISSRAQAPT
jgi:catechol 2,3-dioxygenase-like lactoylglutathione lyase family enzyme